MTDQQRAYLESVERQLWEMSQLAFARGEPWPLAKGGWERNDEATSVNRATMDDSPISQLRKDTA